MAADDVAAALDEDVALVSISHVSYASGAIADMDAITTATHTAGALVMWDLCHTVGSVPVALDQSTVDLAVGCTYKYVNAGPGAPAFIYVAAGKQAEPRQPIWGWFGQRNQFRMDPWYDPEPGIGQYLVGTPSAIGLVGVDEGVKLLTEAGIDRLRAKASRSTSLLVDLHDERLAPLGFQLGSPCASVTARLPRRPASSRCRAALRSVDRAWRRA